MLKSVEQNNMPIRIRDKAEKYRAKLLNFGMQEPSKRESSDCHWHYFKPMTDLTAFIINLTIKDDFIEIVCGYTSTAFTLFAGCENTLVESGVRDEDITIREKYVIRNNEDEEKIGPLIADMYRRYLQTQKNDLLSFAKEKRKSFINQIAIKLKPLGFKKKGNTWTRPLDEVYYLMFNAQKSSFSDEYYFNIYIGKNGTNEYGDCYYTRVAPHGMYPLDWQTLTKEEFDYFLEQTVLPELSTIINTPLNELGKISSYWYGCNCNRDKCESCWMKKNQRDLIEENTYHLPIKTKDGFISLEINHKTIPHSADNSRISISAIVQGVLHTYESDSTEKVLIALAKNLPAGLKIKSCISCRYGHFCPVGDNDNELFCITEFEPKNPRDLLDITENETEREKRCRTLFDCCEKHEEQSEDYYTYNEYIDKINKAD